MLTRRRHESLSWQWATSEWEAFPIRTETAAAATHRGGITSQSSWTPNTMHASTTYFE